MISGFTHAYQALGDTTYLERATRAAQFVQAHLYKADSGVLIRNTYRDGTCTHNLYIAASLLT